MHQLPAHQLDGRRLEALFSDPVSRLLVERIITIPASLVVILLPAMSTLAASA